MINGHFRPVRYTKVALSAELPPHPSKEQMSDALKQSMSHIYFNDNQTQTNGNQG